MLRATNNGITVVIDRRGEIVSESHSSNRQC